MQATNSTISIALCTYNGEAYLKTQLQSIQAQTRLPDELIICDDASTDQTIASLRNFAAQAPFPVHIIQNDIRLGYNKNFEKALNQCRGEFIFICDQDDYWLPDKIELLATYLEEHPDVDIVFSNAVVADEELNDTGHFFWEKVRFSESAQQKWNSGEAIEVLLDGNRMMGCASAMRRRFLDVALPIPAIANYIYDGWLALVAGMKGTIHFYPKPLLIYRTHEKQQVGIRSQPAPKWVTMKDRFSREHSQKLQPFVSKRQRLSDLYNLLHERIPEESPAKAQFRRRLIHYTTRSTLPKSRLFRIVPVMQEWVSGNYKRYSDESANWYAPYLTILGDLFE